MINIKEILKQPTVIDNNHSSLYREYHILEYIMEMVQRDDSKETINDMYIFLKADNPLKENTK